MKSITFVSDPGHGWALVPIGELHALGIVDKISKYSYINPTWTVAALEEDCDLAVYLQALTAANETWTFDERYEENTTIRNWPSFNAVRAKL